MKTLKRSFRIGGGVWTNAWGYLYTAEHAENAESIYIQESINIL